MSGSRVELMDENVFKMPNSVRYQTHSLIRSDYYQHSLARALALGEGRAGPGQHQAGRGTGPGCPAPRHSAASRLPYNLCGLSIGNQ